MFRSVCRSSPPLSRRLGDPRMPFQSGGLRRFGSVVRRRQLVVYRLSRLVIELRLGAEKATIPTMYYCLRIVAWS